MNEDNKKEIRKNVLTGAGTVAGAAIGAVVENTIRTAPSAAEDEAAVPADADIVEAVAGEATESMEETSSTFAAYPVELDEVVVVAQAPARQEAEQPIMAEAVSASPAEGEELLDDIVVVSQGSEPYADAFAIHPPVTAAPAPEFIGAEDPNETLVAAVAVHDPDAMPDYMAEGIAEKADGFSTGITAIDQIDMPDYINNANIDSFTEPA